MVKWCSPLIVMMYSAYYFEYPVLWQPYILTVLYSDKLLFWQSYILIKYILDCNGRFRLILNVKFLMLNELKCLAELSNINVVPVQLFTFPRFVCTFVAFKIHSSIVFYYTIWIIAQKYTLFHISAMKKNGISFQWFKLLLFMTDLNPIINLSWGCKRGRAHNVPSDLKIPQIS